MAKVGIFVGTVYGNALLVAEEAESILKKLGHEVKLFLDGTIEVWADYHQHYVLIVTSTTGEGALPGSIAPLFDALSQSLDAQSKLRYGLISLGDKSYDNFCGAGRRFDNFLQNNGAVRVGNVLEIDGAEQPEPEIITCPWVEEWAVLLH